MATHRHGSHNSKKSNFSLLRMPEADDEFISKFKNLPIWTFSHGCFWLAMVLCYRRPSDGDVQRRHGRQSSARQRPVSTGALATSAAVNASQSSSPGVNARNSVTSASTPSVPLPPPPGQPPAQAAGTVILLISWGSKALQYLLRCRLVWNQI